jgi:hypothetical protein
VGVALIVYGVAGLILLGAGALALAQPLEAVDRLAVSFEQQRSALLTSLRDTSRTLETAADAAAGFDGSLAQSRASATRAAELSREVSTTMAELARSMRISIFGSQPLAGLAPPFERAESQLQQLGADLDAIGAALDANAGQVRTTALELTRLRGSVDRLVTGVEATGDIGLSAGSLAPLRLGILALMVWLAGLAGGCVAAGWSILRWSRRPA